MKIQECRSLSDIVIFFSGHIGTIVSWPFRLFALILGVPNIKIIYKSGHVEYYFFREMKHTTTEGNLARLEWETVRMTKPFYIGLNNIESIHQLY